MEKRIGETIIVSKDITCVPQLNAILHIPIDIIIIRKEFHCVCAGFTLFYKWLYLLATTSVVLQTTCTVEWQYCKISTNQIVRL